MTVVIKEFEVLPEPVSPQPVTTSPSEAPPTPAPLTPHEIALIVRRQNERQARVWAH